MADPVARLLPRRVAVWMIRRYQAVSRFTPPMCRYTPTCSEFARIAVARYGVWKGLWMGVRRVCRCHPFHEGGNDPVP